MENKAFTLAEVLITLGVIGVVAALTLPTVINNIRTKDLESRFKKMDTLIQEAIKKTVYEYGYTDIKEFNIPRRQATSDKVSALAADVENLNKIWLKQFKILREIDSSELVRKKSVYQLDGTVERMWNINIFFNGKKNYLLSNGASISTLAADNDPYAAGASVLLIFDTNSPFKGPNRHGYDIFIYRSDINYYTNIPCSAIRNHSLRNYGCYPYAHSNINPAGKSGKSYWDMLYKPVSYWE